MQANMQHYFKVVTQKKMYSNPKNLQFHMNAIFDGMEFSNKKVLDIGGGKGLYTFYSAAMGAQTAICLEPEGDGSNDGVHDLFREVNQTLGLENAQLKANTLQQFDPGHQTFDLILMHNSINHLDEDACQNLHHDQEAQQTYLELFQRIYDMASPGARLIVCDCSRTNAWALLKLRNPFAPSIEWEKHQSPKLWARLLKQAGFQNPTIRWSSFNRLGKPGKLLLGNKFMAYFLRSHFCLTMQKPR
jgi:SAM-dependent methyltransferase